MANNYIPIVLTSQRGAAVFSAASTLAQARDSLALAKSAMDNMTDGVDWTLIEAAFGIPTGKGQTVYNLIAGSITEFSNNASLIDLIAWLGVIR